MFFRWPSLAQQKFFTAKYTAQIAAKAFWPLPLFFALPLNSCHCVENSFWEDNIYIGHVCTTAVMLCYNTNVRKLARYTVCEGLITNE